MAVLKHLRDYFAHLDSEPYLDEEEDNRKYHVYHVISLLEELPNGQAKREWVILKGRE